MQHEIEDAKPIESIVAREGNLEDARKQEEEEEEDHTQNEAYNSEFVCIYVWVYVCDVLS